MIAQVLLPVPLATCFDYRLSGNQVAIGQRVLVPFGQGKAQVGLVFNIRQADNDEDEALLKPITTVLDDFPVVDAHWRELITFAARYYAEPLGKAFKNAFPKRLRTNVPLTLPRLTAYQATAQGVEALAAGGLAKRAVRQRQLLDYLSHRGKADRQTIQAQGFSKAVVDKLLAQGFIEAFSVSSYADDRPIGSADYDLNDEQCEVIAAITPQLQQYRGHLLYGVTGSGKTEVYIRLIEQVIAQQQQVLLLVPEIGLTPQMLSRFTARFGRRVAAYHSGLSDTARQAIFLAAQAGELPILIGTRSAVFIPMARLGLILLDEEHDLSYKQYEGFLYHARDLAIWRARQLGINIVLGSATPSLESLNNVAKGKLIMHRLRQRATSADLPSIHLVDRRGDGRVQVLSDNVQQKMRRVLHQGKQVLLFLNRRGFAPVVLCAACGWRSNCPDCSVFQTAHVNARQLCCHHCGHIEPLPLRCPDCGDVDLYFAGAGTEKLESQLHQQFPQYRILRLDRDKQTTAKQLDAALARIHAGDVDIILGTQLVVKGHHFPHVDMVCVVDADSALFSSDFRAEERLYQQLIQVAGRAGRESRVGEVYIQSIVPDHEIFHALLTQDYWAYARQLLAERKAGLLPPFTALTLVKASAFDKALVIDYLRAMKQTLNKHAKQLSVLGPVPLAVEKVKNRYHAQLWVSAVNKVILQKHLPLLAQMIKHYDKSGRFKTIIDVDAM